MINNPRKFIKNITKIKVKSFSEELLNNLNNYLYNENNTVKTTKNELFILNNNYPKLIIKLEKNGISYQENKSDKIINIKYKKHENGYYIKKDTRICELYDLGEKTSNHIKTEEVFRIFDKDGFEQFDRVTTKDDTYYEDKTTGKKTLCEPNYNKNYVECEYSYRIDNEYILKRNVRNYAYPDGTKAFIDINSSDHSYIRYELIPKDTKEIPHYGNYYGIDKEIFFNYFQNKATIDDVIDNFHSKKYYIHHNHYI